MQRATYPSGCRASRGRDRCAYAATVANVELSRRVRKVVGYPPLVEMSEIQRRELHEALLEADSFEDLPGKW
jgi:hypothetical protein